MPDKEIMLQIQALEEQRAWSALDAMERAQNEHVDRISFRDALADLAESWRTAADLYDRAKLKGAQTAHVVPLRHAAQQLDPVIKALDQPRRAPLGQLQPVSAPPALDAGLDEPAHRFVPGLDSRTCGALANRVSDVPEPCGRFPSHPAHRLDGPTERPGLDALIADSVAASVTLVDCCAHMLEPDEDPAPWCDGRQGVDHADGHAGPCKFKAHVREDHSASFPGQASADEVTAYLRGEVGDIPAEPPRAQVGAHDMTDPADDLDYFAPLPTSSVATAKTFLQLDNPTTGEIVTIPPVPLLGQPGDAGASYAHSYVPPGGVPLTFAELMSPVPVAALPPHLSHSQIETIGDCPTKYRAQRIVLDRIERGAEAVQEIPQWALIGGQAFHAAVESIENAMLAGATLPPVESDFAETIWRTVFDAEVLKIEASQPVPRSRWRASKQGAEGETWWNANGPEMIRRYLAARPDEPTATLPQPHLTGCPINSAIEIELIGPVSTPYGLIDYKAVLDRVTVRPFAGHDSAYAALIIRDYKTGATMPGDTQQLGEYANLLRLLGVPPQVKILGTFFNARKGTWTPEVDLDKAWPAEWFTYLVTSAHAQRLALTTGPTAARPSSFCGGCSVRWACPVKNAGVAR